MNNNKYNTLNNDEYNTINIIVKINNLNLIDLNLIDLNINKDNIIEKELIIKENNIFIEKLFKHNLDIYDENDLYIEMGIPNVYCKKYFDDEDFIYSNLIFNNSYNHLSINNNPIHYIFQFTNTDLYNKILFINNIINNNNNEILNLFSYLDNIIIIIYNKLSNNKLANNLFINEIKDYNIKPEFYNEMFYGLTLIISHIKMLLNHYYILNIPIFKMKTSHYNKLLNITKNMISIIIYIHNKSTF